MHFAYGLLLAYPIREVFLRIANVRGFWGYFLPLDLTMSTSMLFELIEWGAVLVVGGELGQAYLGTQGDEWDAHKDMALASLGALISMGVTAGINSTCNATSHASGPRACAFTAARRSVKSLSRKCSTRRDPHEASLARRTVAVRHRCHRSPNNKPDEEKKSAWDVSAPPGERRDVPIDTRSGTWMSVDVSPDGKRIAFDHAGRHLRAADRGRRSTRARVGPGVGHAAALLARRQVDRVHVGSRRRRQPVDHGCERRRRAADHQGRPSAC